MKKEETLLSFSWPFLYEASSLVSDIYTNKYETYRYKKITTGLRSGKRQILRELVAT